MFYIYLSRILVAFAANMNPTSWKQGSALGKTCILARIRMLPPQL